MSQNPSSTPETMEISDVTQWQGAGTKDDGLMTLSVGPQHPGSGHIQVQVTLDLLLKLMAIISFIVILIQDMSIEEKRRCVNIATLYKIYLI